MSIDPEVKRALDMRLAKGEISQEEYSKTLESLTESSKHSPTPAAAPAPTPNRPSMNPQHRPAGGPPRVTSNVNNSNQVNVNIPQSPVFAIITLICWLFIAPVGLILNIIGLITGPCRGCFVSMLIFFILVPILVVIVLTAIGVPVLDEIMRAF